ncbi:RluA family pseudouridine synthase [Humisphaera borealis]|uniref:Pseudouridine synthase n=1 Tax=Humisphaera borealis TaxID=2807512 RepID=A0A7M2WTM0_9BACT|nr:RluA family pseudouridine synthase [Humisphaera borealis]QOV88614.1 RluA family pseudouridine synthase [Humisphaera borealis]
MTLSDWLIQQFPHAKRTALRQMVDDRRVLINGKPATRFTAVMAVGDRASVIDRPLPGMDPRMPKGDRARKPTLRESRHYDIVFEDDDILIVYKPPGLLTSTVPNEPRPTLLAMIRDDQARQNLRVRVGLIHRLDRDASGLLVFSKTDEAYQSLKSQFFHHAVQRVYHAAVRGKPKPAAGRIETRLVERADGHVYSTKQQGRGDRAVTDYELVRTVGKVSLVRVTLHTGRKHQIRVHMSQKNWSIVGDAIYGHGEKSPPETGLMLVATKLGFQHPGTGRPVSFEIPLPEEIAALFPEPQKPTDS